MGIFTKSEVIILKESSNAKLYLEKLEKLFPRVKGDVKKNIQKEIAITKAGILGEDNILFELRNSNIDMVVLHDIYLETKDGLGAQIDFVVVTAKLTFLIECKNLFGNIAIDSKGNFVRTIEYGGRKVKEGIYSPITQNERHLMVLKECKVEEKNLIMSALVRGNFDSFHKSLVVLANPKTIVNDRYAKKEIKDQVLRGDQLITVMKKQISESKEISASKKEMYRIAENLLKKNKEDRKDYFAKFEELVSETENDMAENNSVEHDIITNKEDNLMKGNPIEKSHKEDIPIQVEKDSLNADKMDEVIFCPRCGVELILRTAQKGQNKGQQFYGCSSYPKCRYIANI